MSLSLSSRCFLCPDGRPRLPHQRYRGEQRKTRKKTPVSLNCVQVGCSQDVPDENSVFNVSPLFRQDSFDHLQGSVTSG